jgi:hypothetical protein
MSKFQFRKRVKLAPGFSLNLSKKGLGMSAGLRGIKVSRSAQGRLTGSAGLPGSGISYRNTLNANSNSHPIESDDNSILTSIVDNSAYIAMHGPVLSGREMRKALVLLATSTISLFIFLLSAIGPLGFILNPFLILYIILVIAYVRESKKNKKITEQRKIDHLQNCNHAIND